MAKKSEGQTWWICLGVCFDLRSTKIAGTQELHSQKLVGVAEMCGEIRLLVVIVAKKSEDNKRQYHRLFTTNKFEQAIADSTFNALARARATQRICTKKKRHSHAEVGEEAKRLSGSGDLNQKKRNRNMRRRSEHFYNFGQKVVSEVT